MDQFKKDLYSKLLCKANRVFDNSEVYGFLELDIKDGYWMTIIMDEDYEYVYDLDDMVETLGYVSVKKETIKLVNKEGQ